MPAPHPPHGHHSSRGLRVAGVPGFPPGGAPAIPLPELSQLAPSEAPGRSGAQPLPRDYGAYVKVRALAMPLMVSVTPCV